MYKGQRYLSLTVSPLRSVTDLFRFFRPINGQTRCFIHLSYNYKNYSVCSSSCSRATSIPSSSLKHCFTMWRDHIDVGIVGQFSAFLLFFLVFIRYLSTGKQLLIIFQIFLLMLLHRNSILRSTWCTDLHSTCPFSHLL